ncbi:SDR family NAD(P)-dependent oxidoreductase [Microbacterium oryzae]|uniref:SDR family NAD(P)-dependent oxidoreductase n=1 Tax=Microbacterium oryzae TaxID=743009 RepID=UPI0025AF02FD|nr:SDR family NAD(P)-dependent oxidoreductase [Microbacterium oryzae]MDN3310220.1 SDR family NAD(P)-dependent oxidoreductase [Microbacterium oryzae]
MNARTAIVSGGARGIGDAIAQRLQAHGVDVVSLDIAEPPVPREGVLYVSCDIADPGAVSSAVERVAAERGAVSVLVHCAAFQRTAPFVELQPADWARTFRVNVDGAFHLLQATVPGMRAAGWGRIVLITSSTYFTPPAGMSHYIASKGALTGLVRGLSMELGADGITVNAVAPGLTGTDNAIRDIPESHFALVRGRQAIPRTGEPDDIAAAVGFLVSDDASFISGQTVLVDGGESRV